MEKCNLFSLLSKGAQGFVFLFFASLHVIHDTMPSKEEYHVGVHETSVDNIVLRYGSRQKRASNRLVHFQNTLCD